MARSKNNSRQRDFSIPNQSLGNLLSVNIRPAPVLIPVPTYALSQEILSYAPDRRLFDPTRSVRSPGAVRKANARVVVGRNLDGTRFADPRFVGICVRRKTRREVIFAKRKAGKGAKSVRRFNFWSKVSCR